MHITASGAAFRAAQLMVAITLLSPVVAWGAEPVAPMVPGKSATIARDINGFTLGMRAADVRTRVKVTFTQGELLQGSLDGISYDFGVCRSGKVYRIQSSQNLGTFNADYRFLQDLGARLAAKYGQATSSELGNWSWNLVEQVRYTDGQVHPVATNWATALVLGGSGSPVELNLTLLDFRICWADAIHANEQPQADALGKVVM